MINKLKRIFNPTPEERAEDYERLIAIHKEFAKDKDCSTCGNLRHIIHYPGFVTGEEWKCTAELECDTVLFSVKNCPRWTDSLKEGDEE